MPKENTIIDDFTDDDKVESNLDFWKFQEQTEVIGLFQRWEQDNYGEHPVILTASNEELHLPNLTSLNGKLKQKDVEKGDKVKAVYTGEKKAEKSGRMYQDFEVFVKKTE